MISRIVSLNPNATGSFAPLLAGASPCCGTPLVMGFELGNLACGALAADCFEDAVTLRWLAVDKFCRRRGIAEQLLEKLCELAANAGAKHIDAIICQDSMEPMEYLLIRKGFTPLEQTPVYSFPLSVVLNGPLHPLDRKKDRRVVALNSLPSYLLQKFNRRIADYNESVHLNIDHNAILPESVAWLENEKITGCLLLAPCGNDVEIRWLYSDSAISLQGMISEAARLFVANHSAQTIVHASALTPNITAFIQKLAGDELTVHPSMVRYSLEL